MSPSWARSDSLSKIRRFPRAQPSSIAANTSKTSGGISAASGGGGDGGKSSTAIPANDACKRSISSAFAFASMAAAGSGGPGGKKISCADRSRMARHDRSVRSEQPISEARSFQEAPAAAASANPFRMTPGHIFGTTSGPPAKFDRTGDALSAVFDPLGTIRPCVSGRVAGGAGVRKKQGRRHGIAPVRSDHPAYQYMRDPDGDGVVCE